MPTLRYKNEFDSNEDVAYEIQVDDNTWALATADFISGVGGFDLTYSKRSEISPRIGYIMPSTITFDFKTQDTAADNLQSDLINANEERFKVKILRNGALHWSGFVLTDNVFFVDEARPSQFQIYATDGMGRLKDIDYNDDGIPYTGRATILEHIYNCLNKIPFSYFYSSGDVFLKVIVNWYEIQHNVTSTLDPFTVTDFDHSVFVKTSRDGVKTYTNCYNVLVQCLKIAGCRMYHSGGAWIIEQINERENATFTEFRYDLDAVHLSTNTSQSYEVNILDAIIPCRVATGIYPFYPPLDEVCIRYDHNGSENLLLGAAFQESPFIEFPSQDEITIGSLDLSGNGDETMIVAAKINYTSTWIDVNNLLTYRHAFRIKLKIGNYYLKRPIVPQGSSSAYGVMEWSTDESYYEVSTFPLYQAGSTANDTIITSFLEVSFETPPIPSGGDIDFNIFWYECRNSQNNELIVDSLPGTIVALRYGVVDHSVHILQSGTQYNMETYRKYCVQNTDSDTNTGSLELKTVIGDGPFNVTFNKLKVWDGSNWQPSNDWRVNDTGDAYQIQELLIREILIGQKTSIKKYEGEIIGDIFAHSRLNWDNEYYLFEGGTFNAQSDIVSGKWFNIITVPGSLIAIEPEPGTGGTEVNLPIGQLPGIGGPFSSPSTGGIATQSAGSTAVEIPSGFIETITFTDPIAAQYRPGDILNVVDPINGNVDQLTVVTANQPGSRTLNIEGYINNDYPAGASIVPAAPESIEENQLSGEIVTEFFEPGVIDKSGYYLKTNALIQETIEFPNLAGLSTTLTVGTLGYFYRVPSAMDGAIINKIFTSFYTAGTSGNSTVRVLNNGSGINTATIASGAIEVEDTLTSPEELSTGDVLTVEVLTLATTPPDGLDVSLEYTRDAEIYLNKIQYQLSRVEIENLILWNQFSYLPQIPIGSGSVYFEGDAALDCGNDSSLDITEAITIMTWVKFDDLTPVTVLAGKYSSLQGYSLTNYGSFIALVSDLQTSCNFSTTGMTEKTWYHVAATWDGTTAKIYLDGVESDTETYTAPTSTSGSFKIGALSTGVSHLTGSMAMARLWSRALSQLEIQSILNKRYNQLTASERVDMVSSWELNDFLDDAGPDSHGDNDSATI